MAEEFKTIARSTIRPAEKNKKINEFIKNVAPGDVDKILSTLKTDFNLEWGGIQLKFAEVFKRSDLVIDILKNGSAVYISQAVKFQWMFAEGSVLENPVYLVGELFPACSYSCRQKVINNIGAFMKRPDKVNSIFDQIEKTYGFYVALPLLKGCSKDKINSVLSSRNVKFGDEQLIKIAKKFPDIAVNYLRQHYKAKSAYEAHNYVATLKYLVDAVPDDFMKLFTDFPDFINSRSFKLGIKRSKKILRANPQHVIDNSQGYTSVLSIRQFRQQLTWEQYKTVFLSLVNKSKEHFTHQWSSNSLWSWIENLSNMKKIEMLQGTFSSAFGKQIHECSEYLTANMINLLPDDQRLSAIEYKIENENANDSFRFHKSSTWMSYEGHPKAFWTTMKPTNLSVPQLTQLLYVEQDVGLRATLSKFLILTCVVNDNSKDMTSILQLLNKRCRNDQPTVRCYVIDALSKASSHMELKKEHWDGILEIIQLSQLYKEINQMTSDVQTLLHRSIAYHLNNKLPMDVWLDILVKINANDHYSNWDFDLSLIKDPLDQKTFLESYILKLGTACPVSQEDPLSDTVLEGVIALIKKISNWNMNNEKTHGRIPILSNPWLANVIVEFFKSDGSNDWYLRSQRHTNDKIRIFNLLRRDEDFNVDTLLTSVASEPFLSFFFREDPDRLCEGSETIISESLQASGTYMKFIRRLKSLNYACLTEKFVKECKALVDQEDIDDATQTCNAFKILSILTPSSDFLLSASKFYPTDKKVDFADDKTAEAYQVKTAIASSLKNLSNPRDAFPAIEKFSVGDYLKLVSASLYSCCSRAPQNESLLFLKKQLSDQPVSVKKNMIRLFFMISPLSDKSDILCEMWKAESNPSIRSEIFKQMYRLFNNQRSQQTWSVLKSSIQSLSADDIPCLDFLRHSTILDDAPTEFLSDFFQSSLEAVVRVEVKDGAISSIVSRISNVIDNISDQLLDRLVQGGFKNPQSKSKKKEINADFCAKYLLSAASSVENSKVLSHRLNIMKAILKDLIENHWHATKGSVTVFLESVCQQQLESKTTLTQGRKEILQGLFEEFHRIPWKTFRENLYLDLTLLFDEIVVEVKQDSEKLSRFGNKVGQLLEVYVKQFGGEIIGLISEILGQFVDNNCLRGPQDNDIIVNFIDGLLSHSSSRHHLIVALGFMPFDIPQNPSLLTTYEKVLNIVENSEDLAIKVLWNRR